MKKRHVVVLSLVAAGLAVAMLVPLASQARTEVAKNRRLESVTDLATLLVEAERANTVHDIAFERRLLERSAELPGTPPEAAGRDLGSSAQAELGLRIRGSPFSRASPAFICRVGW